MQLEKNEEKNFFNKNFSYLNIFHRIFVYFQSWLERQEKKIVLRTLLKESNSYEEWSKYAKELDIVEYKHQWKQTKESTQYDYKEVENLIKILRKKKEMKDISGLVHHIRAHLVKNLYSTLNPKLYQLSNHGTKYLIDDFHEEMIKSFEFISNFNEKILPITKKLEFFSETRHSYGRTALLLSGGASMGIYHIGVVKTLYEQNLLPRIVCGSSAGSILASLVCSNPYEQVLTEIEKEFRNGGPFQYKQKNRSIFSKILNFITSGVLYDVEVLRESLREELGDVTFQEAFDRTGWILNITVTGYKEHSNHRLLNYLTAPNVLIWSASCASCSVPGLFDPTELMCKNQYGHIVPYYSNRIKFIDGSISADLPMQRLSELFNVNIFIVSQVNPWVIPFLDQDDKHDEFYSEKTFNLWKLIKTLIFSEIKHRVIQIQTIGILPNFITKWFNIITQEYRGHVTIFPVPKLVDYIKVLDNPSKEQMKYATIHASRRTYPKVSFIKGILNFEFALEKFHRKLKLRLNQRRSIFKDKKYLMELQEAFDGHTTKLIIQNANLYNAAEKKLLNFNFQDFILNAEHLTNSSNYEMIENLDDKGKELNNENDKSDVEDISDKYNQVFLYNREKQIDLKNNEIEINSMNKENEDLDNVSPIICLGAHKKNKTNIKINSNQMQQQSHNIFINRHNSFILPRTASKS